MVFEGQDVCGPDCCYVCVEAFGVLFLGLSALAGVGFHGYQGVILYRLHSKWWEGVVWGTGDCERYTSLCVTK